VSAPQGARLGLDLVEVERFHKALSRRPGLKTRLFTPGEIAYCESHHDATLSFAARFAAKEAVGKLLGTGVIIWRDIEVTGEKPPKVVLHGETVSL
jgi:holo-[acyl-carrier protein] synthase